jgi:hypothetical protein
MSGTASISSNTGGNGGGVALDNSGSATVFEMDGGTISGNTAAAGGGVYNTSGTFTMKGGTLYGDANYTYGPSRIKPDSLGNIATGTSGTQSLYGIVNMSTTNFYLGTSQVTSAHTYNASDRYSDVNGNTLYVVP